MTIRALGDALLVEGVAELRLIKWALWAGMRENRRNGKTTSEVVIEAAATVDAALQQSVSGHADVREVPVGEDLVTWIGTLQAAEILGCTQRHVRRIASSLDGRRAGKAWVFSSDTVQQYRDLEDARDDRTRAA